MVSTSDPDCPAVTLTAIQPAGIGRQRSINAPQGRPVTFHGCVAACCPTPSLAVVGAAGRIVALDGTWHLTNLSLDVTLRVWRLDDPRDGTHVPPGISVSPPFDLAGITGASGHVLTVFGPQQTPTTTACCVGASPVAWGLDPQSRRHDVMIALVTAAMQGDTASPVPTARTIGAELGMSHRTVQEHLRALVVSLKLSAPQGRRSGWIRDALVEYALHHTYIPPTATEPA